MELVDTHCHLQFDDFDNVDKIIAEAQDSSVKKLICVGTTLADSQRAIELAADHDNVWAAVGVHPHDAEAFNDQSAAQLEKLLKQPEVVAMGETGLDYFKNYSAREAQKAALRLQIGLGIEANLPFIFHVRDAWDDFWQILGSYLSPSWKLRGAVHSFSANEEQLEKVLEHDLLVGLNGIMTFTKDEAQLSAAKKVPKDRLLLETDAPFLSPAPNRGRRCEPKDVVQTAKFLAELRRESLEGLAAYTTANAKKLFKLQ